MASFRPLPTGRCNYRNLNVKTTDYNTHCGCQTFWLDEGVAQEQTFALVSTSSTTSTSDPDRNAEGGKDGSRNASETKSSSNAESKKASKISRPQQGLCVCGHHQCFHSFRDEEPSDRQKYPGESRFQTPPKHQDHNALVNLSKTFDDRAALERQEEGLNAAATHPEWHAMGLGPGAAFSRDGLGLSFRAMQNRDYGANRNYEQQDDRYNRFGGTKDGTGHQTSDGTLQNGITAPSPVPSSSITEVATNISFTPGQHYNPNISISNNNHTSSPLQRAVQQRQFVSNTVAPQYYSPHQAHHHQLQELEQSPHLKTIQPPPPPQEHQQLNRMAPLILHDAVSGTPTVIDSPLVTNPQLYFSLSQRAMGALRTLNEISMSLLPPYLQQRQNSNQIQVSPSPTAPRILAEVLSPESHVSEEVTRFAMAAEGATKDLLQCLERSRSQVQSDSPPQATPQKSSSSGQVSSGLRPPPLAPPPPSSPPALNRPPAITPSSAKSAISNGSMFSSIPPPKLEPSDMSLRSQLQVLKEKFEALEDALEDTANKAELAEDKVMDMEGRMVHVEDKIDGVAESFSRHKDGSSSSLGKRSREDGVDHHDRSESHYSKHSKREGKRRRKQKGTEAEESELYTKPQKSKSKSPQDKNTADPTPETCVKQVTTTTRTSFTTSTCTSFASNGSGDSVLSYHAERLLSNLVTQLTSLNARISVLEDLAPPTTTRPWVIEIVVLPPSTWAAWKRQDGSLALKSHAPRALHTGSKAWRRLCSRGLIKTVEVVGGEARDVERAIRKNFGGLFRTLQDSQSLHSLNVSYEWSPLRKAPKQSNLRFLRGAEMERGFWKADFLKRTCATELFPPQPSQPPSSAPAGLELGTTQSRTLPASGSSPRPSEQQIRRPKKWPTHRLWITNCWTGSFSGPGSWDDVSDYTQMSSRASVAPPSLRRRASSVASTQKSSLMGTLRRRRTGNLQAEEESPPGFVEMPFAFGLNGTGELGGGWDDVKKLPRYLEASSIEAASAGKQSGSSNTIAGEGSSGIAEPYWDFDETLDGPLSVDSSEDNPSFAGSSLLGPATTSSETNSNIKGVNPRRRPSKCSTYKRESFPEVVTGQSSSNAHSTSAEGNYGASINDESPLRNEVFEEEEDGGADESNSSTPRPGATNTFHSAPTPRARSPAHWRLSQLSSSRPGSYPIGNQYVRRFAPRLRNENLTQNQNWSPRGLISSEVGRLTDLSANEGNVDEGVGDEEEIELNIFDVGGDGEEDEDDEDEQRRLSRSPTEEV